jgi:hypothetical protein
MNNKRTLVIAAVAGLAVILSVAASLVFPSSASSAQLIPVTGLSKSGVSADNSGFTNTGESPEEEYILSQQNHAADNSSVTNTGESPEEEFILSQQNHAADNSNVLSVPKTFSAPAASQPALQVTGEFCPFTVQELQSLHTVSNKNINVSMLETSDGPIGYDGGTFSLGQCRISK